MTTFGGATIPPLFVSGGGGGIITDVIVDNSAVQGQVALGGWIFPIDAVADRGHYKVGRRDGSGDSVLEDQNWSSEPPLDPPDYVMNVLNQVGDPCDAGNSAWRAAFSTACLNIANGARWITNAGIFRSVSLSFTIQYQFASGPNTCPGTGIFLEQNYTVNATFTG